MEMADIFSKRFVVFLRLVHQVDPACQKTPDVFFPEDTYDPHQSMLAAKSLCRACPIQVECAFYAINAKETGGVWGGLSPQDRVRARARVKRLRK
jgi:hypothetical protein